MKEEKKMTFGGITLGGNFGGIELVNVPASSLPQDAASAIGGLNAIHGATYEPIWYIGKQVVNGINYFFIAKEVRITKTHNESIVAIVINVPPGSNGEGSKIVRVIEEMVDAPPEAEVAFAVATKTLIGATYKPVLYVGEQVVNGINYYYVAEVKAVYPNAEPHAAMVVVNVKDGKTLLVSVNPLMSSEPSTETNVLLGAPLGEWP
jgi:hypothetical protein